jgi:2-polyprenyl-3-methyl-5-hydroxy-6-metoxy-1,4-benzoquinol methylase
MNRKEILLNNVTKEKLGLEIGPSHAPIAKKKDGYNVEILDYLDENKLKIIYEQRHNMDVSDIEKVDYIFNGEKLPELVKNKKFNWIIASHVIEHVPDLIGFLQGCEEILENNGQINLAIPDKRQCFDINRECSSLSRVIDIHEFSPKHQSVGAITEYFLKVCTKNNLIAWAGELKVEGIKIHSLEEINLNIEKTRQDIYVDIHNWVFTPESFESLINDLIFLKYINLKLEKVIDTIGCEFFVILKK